MINLNIVTAVSRPENLRRILASIDATVHLSGLNLKWILVFDAPSDAPPALQVLLDAVSKFRVQKAFWLNGPSKYGIHQKNMGIDLCDEGFYYLLDDDNIIHPNFFKRVGELILENPDKEALAFNQQRWDAHGSIVAAPERMHPGGCDNSMFVVHTKLIGKDRYDYGKASLEDGYFFQGLHLKKRETFLFVNEFLAYYNYIRHFPEEK